MLKDFTPRLYQETILSTCSMKNTLVVLPTGLGKTAIALLLAVQRLTLFPKSNIIFLAPTKPLVDQHKKTFDKHLDIDPSLMHVFTGDISPEKRMTLWNASKIIFSTPQGLENDIISNRIDLQNTSLIIFDEAHRAVGNYSYVFIAEQYLKKAKFPRILALTASPGTDNEKIDEICKNLKIEGIEIRTENDYDVKPYVQDIKIDWVEVELNEQMKKIRSTLKIALSERIKKLSELLPERKNLSSLNKKDLIALQFELRSEISSSEKNYDLWNALSLLAEIMKLHHSLELVETQGIKTLVEYLEKLQQDGFNGASKAAKNLSSDSNFKSACFLANQALNIEHPKISKLKELISNHLTPDGKFIIFTQYRDSAVEINNAIKQFEGIRSEIFVGQTKKKDVGLSQKKQKELIEKFRNGDFNVLVMTSVGEEGLDIPSVDFVIFFEPIPSAIRHIQRRGRTGRHSEGCVYILTTKDTRDVAYRWSAFHKEKKMYKVLDNLKTEMSKNNLVPKSIKSSSFNQTKLSDSINNTIVPISSSSQLSQENISLSLNSSLHSTTIQEKKLKLYCDHRERHSKSIKLLMDKDVEISLEQLKVGDFVVSDRVAIEFKTVNDFVDSIIDKRLLLQVRELKNNFLRPLIIIEGEEDIYSVRNIHPNAIRGMISAITIDFGIPILFTKNPAETAEYIHTILKRENDDSLSNTSLHGLRRPMTFNEQQEYILSSFPGIGISTAKKILKQVKTIKSFIVSDKLEDIDGIGEKTAKSVNDILNREYDG